MQRRLGWKGIPYPTEGVTYRSLIIFNFSTFCDTIVIILKRYSIKNAEMKIIRMTCFSTRSCALLTRCFLMILLSWLDRMKLGIV